MHQFRVCARCNEKQQSKQNGMTGQTPKNNKFNTNGYPSHTELYRDFHKIEHHVIKYIFLEMGWTGHIPEEKKLFGKNEAQTTAWRTAFEVNGWDIVFWIDETPEEKLLDKMAVKHNDVVRGMGKDYENSLVSEYRPLVLEYKSSVQEWGKQFDDFIRQMRKRKDMGGVPFLISFDPEFEAFEKASESSGFFIIVLPPIILELLRSDDPDKLWEEHLKNFDEAEQE